MIQIYTDGASRGNPGNAAWAFVIVDTIINKIIHRDTGLIAGTATNNDAEYTAIIEALRTADKNNITEVTLFSDSEIVIRQLTGQYKCKEPRLAIKKEFVRDMERSVRVDYHNVPRSNEFVKVCDRMCNDTLDAEVNNGSKSRNPKES